jgi:hypothetical protein
MAHEVTFEATLGLRALILDSDFQTSIRWAPALGGSIVPDHDCNRHRPRLGSMPLAIALRRPAHRRLGLARYQQEAPSAGIWLARPCPYIRSGCLGQSLSRVDLAVIYWKNRTEVHKRNLAKESGSAAELTPTPGQPKVKNADQRHIARNPVRRVQHVIPAKRETAQTPDTAKEDDPVEPWKAIKRGNVNGANLYLQGKSVPQNCEQAHMLLQTASTKGSKAADTLLKSSYPERCE